MTASDEPRSGEKGTSEGREPRVEHRGADTSVDATAQQDVAPGTHRTPAAGGNPRPAKRDQIGDGMETDQLTIRRAIEGDERALRQLWLQYAPRIEAVVLRLAGDADLAADIAQEVWMQIFRALPTFRGDSQFGTWAHRIAVNRTLNALRKARRTSRVEVEITEDAALVEADDDRSFVASTIERAAARLPEGARTVFVLHDVEGYTHEDIARELGITAGASKSQLFKARAKLRRLLAPLLDVPEPAADGVHATPGS
jgi:RNA polymerase sigma-70 factor (ECF subfamily)